MLAAGMLLAAGCAAGAPALVDLHPWSPPAGQRCQVNSPIGELGAFVDSAAVADGIAALDPPAGGLLLSVSADSGEIRRLRRIETTFPGSIADQVENTVEAAAAPDPDARVSGRLIVAVNDSGPAITLGSSQTCRPKLRNVSEMQQALQQVHGRTRLLGTANIWMRVDTTGTVTTAQVNGSSGYPALDVALVLISRGARFHPALSDRRPLTVWVAMDFTVQKRGEDDDEWPPAPYDPGQ